MPTVSDGPDEPDTPDTHDALDESDEPDTAEGADEAGDALPPLESDSLEPESASDDVMQVPYTYNTRQVARRQRHLGAQVVQSANHRNGGRHPPISRFQLKSYQYPTRKQLNQAVSTSGSLVSTKSTSVFFAIRPGLWSNASQACTCFRTSMSSALRAVVRSSRRCSRLSPTLWH